MTLVSLERDARLATAALDALPCATPFLALDLDAVELAYARLRRALPRVRIHYAVKCNPEPALLERLHALGSAFEIASLPELEALAALGVDPRDVLYGNPVKPVAHVAGASALGLDRFTVDSRGELERLALHAPGARVLVRLTVADGGSRLPLAGKFGVDVATATQLLVDARELGLVPHGVTFHVGSQALDPDAFRRALGVAGAVLDSARRHRIRLELVDLGGGFPARYTERVPPLSAYAAAVEAGIDALPYAVEAAAEPGRSLVAEAGVLATTVLGVAWRDGRRWIHLDAGTFNGLMETLETRRELRYPLAYSARDAAPVGPATLAGPTCDSEDTLFLDVPVPVDLEAGERVYIGSAGAYTTAYASRFNGFDVPATVVL
jgi:ornithine decarboxylase